MARAEDETFRELLFHLQEGGKGLFPQELIKDVDAI